MNVTDAELNENDLIVEKMHIHHGQKSENPVLRLRFFGKDEDKNPYSSIENKTKILSPSPGLPFGKNSNFVRKSSPVIIAQRPAAHHFDEGKVYEKMYIRVFCRNSDPSKVRTARKAFYAWCSAWDMASPHPPQDNIDNDDLDIEEEYKGEEEEDDDIVVADDVEYHISSGKYTDSLRINNSNNYDNSNGIQVARGLNMDYEYEQDNTFP